MDDEKKDQEFIEEPEQQETEGQQEEFGVEDSFDEMDNDIGEDVAPAKEKGGFWKELSHQAVSKIFLLFAGIGFFFPFFTIACQGQETGLVTKGFDMFKDYKIPIQQGIDIPVPSQPIIIAAFAVIIIGLILTVFLKGMARNISGAVCSLIALVIMAGFVVILPQTIIETIKSFAATVGLTDPTQLGDLSVIQPVLQPGFYFVASLLLIDLIYFIVQIAIDSKRKAKEVMEFDGDDIEETDFDYTDAEIIEEPIDEEVVSDNKEDKTE